MFGLTCCEDDAVVLLNDLFTDRQSDTGAGVFRLAIQPLKDLEYLLLIFGIKANSVVLNVNSNVRRIGRQDKLFLILL